MLLAKIIQTCRCPVYAEMLKPRAVALCIAAIGAAQIGFSLHGYGFPCMFRQTTGIPCPGCGLTRSCMALLHGDLGASLAFHPLGPALLLAITVALLAAIFPASVRNKMIAAIARLEYRTGLAPVALGLLMIIWILRVTHLVPLTPL